LKNDKILKRATGGQDTIADDMMPASGIRPLIFDDPGLLFLRHHGAGLGYLKDSGRYRLLPFLSKLGADFEQAYIDNEAPNAVRLLKNNREVRNKASFELTLEHLAKGTKFMWQVALWWYPEQIFGVADAVVHTSSWLYKRYPHLKPIEDEPPHHCLIEFKFSRDLESTGKQDHLRHASSQLRLYSYILGQLQAFMPPRAYIISRDTIDSPIVVDVELKLDQPLDDELSDLRDAYLDIKRRSDLRPWKDPEVRLNPSNKSDEPYHDAKQEILKTMIKPRSLLMLSGVGPETARKMRLHGFKDIDDLLSRDIDRLQLEKVDGIYPALAERLRATLKANKSGKASDIPSHPSLRSRDVEIMLDVEYLSSLRPDFDEWPLLSGTPMIFMIGCGYKRDGKWTFKRFTAEEETHEAEAKMLRKFLSFLRSQGVFDVSKTSALYHFSSAEVWQMRNAALRHDLPQLETLPFVDLREVFMEGPICLPGCWNFGLKEIMEALGAYAPYYRVEWPDGMSGQAAQVAGWMAYDDDEPLKSPEMRLIAEYLEKDCVALERIFAWLRNNRQPTKKKAMGTGWYRSVNATLQISARSEIHSTGWYRQ
jgi:predicted RecB family nuclease